MEPTDIFIIYTFLSLNSCCKIDHIKLQCGPKVQRGWNLVINMNSSLVKLSAYLRNTDEHGLNYMNCNASDRVLVGWQRYVQTDIVRLWWSDQQYVPAPGSVPGVAGCVIPPSRRRVLASEYPPRWEQPLSCRQPLTNTADCLLYSPLGFVTILTNFKTLKVCPPTPSIVYTCYYILTYGWRLITRRF